MYVLKEPNGGFVSQLDHENEQLNVEVSFNLRKATIWDTFGVVYRAALNIEVHHPLIKCVIYRKKHDGLVCIGTTEETERLYVNYKETKMNP